MTEALPKITVLITTRNRRDDLQLAVESCLAQDYPEAEILVFDDASEDDTVDILKRHYPEVRLFTNETQRERLELRNKGFREAAGSLILMLDDDCYLTEKGLFRRIAHFFERRPGTAVACIPMIEPSRPRNYMPREPEAGEEMGSFLAGASVFRREALLDVKGYREILVRHEEERDLALRLMNSGWQFHYLGGPPIVHTVSPRRDSASPDLHGLRNTVLVWFLNLPVTILPMRMAVSCVNSIRYRFRWAALPIRLKGLLWGLASCWTYRKHRRAVSRDTFDRYRRLPRHGAIRPNGASATPLKRTAELNRVSTARGSR